VAVPLTAEGCLRNAMQPFLCLAVVLIVTYLKANCATVCGRFAEPLETMRYGRLQCPHVAAICDIVETGFIRLREAFW
jgi:hypothetical protein